MRHPFYQFQYCPECGARAFVEHDVKSKRCEVCGFVYYFNPAASVACFVKNAEGELLLVRRGEEPARGTLDLPGGFAERFETGEQAAQREVKEETGLEITSCRYLFSLPNIYLYSGFEVHTLDMFFECEVASFENVRANDDASAVVILPPKELDPSAFGLHSIREAVSIYRKEHASR